MRPESSINKSNKESISAIIRPERLLYIHSGDVERVNVPLADS